LGSDACQAFFQGHLASKQQAIGIFESLNPFLIESLSLKANTVDTVDFGIASDSHSLDEWQSISRDHTVAANKGMHSNTTELVNSGECPYRRVIPNFDMASECSSISEDDVIPNSTVMRDMYAGHQKVPTSDPGVTSTTNGPPINRDKLANDIVISHFETRLFSSELEVLRVRTNRTMTVEAVVPSDSRWTFQHSEWPDRTMIPNDNMIPNYGVGSNSYIAGQFCFG